MRDPNFLCIGAPKAGTTWLYHQLKAHPEVWLPHVKELHYFDWVKYPRLFRLLLQRDLIGRHTRSALVRGFIRPQRIPWTLRYLFGSRSLAKYPRMFEPGPGQICGEITPGYMLLPQEQVEALARQFPQCQILFMLRNPIDRVWSQLRMAMQHNPKVKGMDAMQAWALINARLLRFTEYLDTLDRWEAAFGTNRIWVGYYDDIELDPATLLGELYEFLDITNDLIPEDEALAKKHNAGLPAKLPAALEVALSQHFLPQLEALHERFQHQYTQKWLHQAQATISA